MKILHVSRDYYPDLSGVAEVSYQLTTELARRGHEVWVATGPQLNPSNGPAAPGVRVRRFEVSGNFKIGIRGDSAGYLNFVLGGDWDAVTIHSVVGWPIELLLPHMGRVSGSKVVVNHDDKVLSRPDHKAYRGELGNALRNVDTTVVLSRSLVTESFYQEFNLAPAAVIPNGVDLEQWSTPPSALREAWEIGDRPWLITVALHTGRKRHDRFFEVVRQVRCAIPRAAGTIIGRSHPAERYGLGRLGIRGGCWYKCKLAQIAAEGVTLQSTPSRADTISAIKEADLLLLTSDSEASPLVILESMAAGTPWISLDVGCVREHVGGIVVNSCKEMAEAAKCLIEDGSCRAKLGAEGRARAQERHDWSHIATAYEQLYCRLATSKRV